jgi:tetratricopeptide (TPR) repeat protein
MLLIILWRRVGDYPIGLLDFCALAVIILPCIYLPFGLLWGSSRNHHRVLRAVARADWELALELVDRFKDQMPEREVALRRAQALIGLGEIDRGLRTLQKLEFTSDLPDWLYWSLLAELHVQARNFEAAFAAHEKAVALAPNNATVLLAYADDLAEQHHDLERARQLHEWARQCPVSDLLRHAERFVDGMIAFESGEPRRARQSLEEALEHVELLAGQALYPLLRGKIDAYLCLACAALADHDAAAEHFRRVEWLLHAHRKHELLARCEAAMMRGS